MESYSNMYDNDIYGDICEGFDEDEGLRPSKRPRLDQGYEEAGIVFDHRSERSTTPEPDDNLSELRSSPFTQQDDWTFQRQQPDICLGVLTQATFKPYKSSKSKISRTRFQVTLRSLGSDVAVHEFEGTNRMLGVLDSAIGQHISHFMDQMNIEFEAYVQDEDNTHSRDTAETRGLDIVVYVVDANDNFEQFGSSLSQRGLHLQHPALTDAVHKPYRNPQYFLPQGASFPDLDRIMQDLDSCHVSEDLSQNLYGGTDSKPTLFDTAKGPTIFTPIEPSHMLRTQLDPHQIKAVSMMVEKEKGLIDNPDFPAMWARRTAGKGTTYRNIITGESKERPRVSFGGLLADDMGLGKTLSIIALIASTLEITRSIRPASRSSVFDITSFGLSVTLVVAPKTTIDGWVRQLKEHVRQGQINVCQYYGRDRIKKLQSGPQNYDVILTTYGIVAKEHATSSKDNKSSSPLFATQWFRVVFDEAHFLRNTTTKLYKATYALRSEKTWLATGTPIQNSIQDFESVVQLTRCSPFDNPGTFAFHISQRVKNNDKAGFKALRALIRCLSLRRTKEILSLPAKTPREERIQLCPDERQLYDVMSDKLLAQIDKDLAKGVSRKSLAHVMEQILRLRQICNHGRDLLPDNLKGIEIANVGMYADESAQLYQCETCGAYTEDILTDMECGHIICIKCPKKLHDEQPELESSCPICCGAAADLDNKHISLTAGKTAYIRPSSKVLKLVENLHKIDSISLPSDPNKSVVFSEWTSMLDLVQVTLKKEGFVSARIDGQMKSKQWKSEFNRFCQESTCTILLASIRNAGTGIDILKANHVHLLEAQWNPMVEEQALDRVHRLGQKRPVTTYRYVVQDSIEQYVQQMQRHKLALISASLDAYKDDKKLTIMQKLVGISDFLHNQTGNTPAYRHKV